MKENQREITGAKTFQVNGINIRAQWSDTLDGFAFRLALPEHEVCGNWQGHYESFASVQSPDGREFRMGSAYWDGTFTIETPFEVIFGKEVA